MASLELFTTTSRDAAIDSFRGWRKPKGYCGDRFVVCGASVLFFAPLDEIKLLTPGTLEWWPRVPEDYPGEKTRWLPKAVQPKYDVRWKKTVREVFLFLEKGSEWLSCGPVRQSYHQQAGGGRFDDQSHVGYMLRTRLPYDDCIGSWSSSPFLQRRLTARGGTKERCKFCDRC